MSARRTKLPNQSYSIILSFRICLRASNILKSMFHCTIGNQSYAQIYEFCTGFAVIDKLGAPNRICNSCEEKLITFYDFRMNIEEVEGRLLVYLSQLTEIEHCNDTDTDLISFESPQPNDENFLVEAIEGDLIEMEADEPQYELAETFEEVEEPSTSQEMISSCRFIQSETNQTETKCATCDESCELEELINKGKPEESCPVICQCEKTYKNRRSFLKHFASYHSDKQFNYVCSVCSEAFTSWRSKISHKANVHNVGFKHECSYCKKKFYRSDHCKGHEKKCHETDEQEKFFSCGICLFTFQREDTFKKHLESAHVGVSDSEDVAKRAEEYAQKYSSGRAALADNKEEAVHSLVCDVCHKIFRNERSLHIHKSSFHSNRVWSCEKCDAVFVHRSTKLSHMTKEHGAKKPFQCSFLGCGLSFLKKDRYVAHIEKHKNPDKTFACPICSQEFKSYNSMTHHRSRHLTKETIVCQICSKQFLDKRNFNVHLKLHTGAGLFECTVCNRGFNRKEHLQKHQERKHGGAE